MATKNSDTKKSTVSIPTTSAFVAKEVSCNGKFVYGKLLRPPKSLKELAEAMEQAASDY